MRRLLLSLLPCLALAATAPSAKAIVLDFEGLPSGSKIPDGYGGFQWSEWFYAFDAASYYTSVGPNGYTNGLVSGSNVAFNAFATNVGFGPTSGTFTLNSLYLTAAWNNGLNVDIVGYLAGSPVTWTSVVVNASGPTHVVLDWTGIDEVRFSSYGGVHAGLEGRGEHFALDDVRVNEPTGVPVPEPFTAALGLGGLALAARRRRR